MFAFELTPGGLTFVACGWFFYLSKDENMSTKLTIVAKIIAKSDRVDFVKTELIKLIEPTLKEAGCVQYDLHQDNNDPAVFLFFENWESRELWQHHMQSDHLKAFQTVTDGAVSDIQIMEMTRAN